jgi:hypothetical protein
MIRIASLSAFVYGALSAVNAFAVDPTLLAADSANRPATASWRPTGDLPNLSIAAFQQGTSGLAADSQVADIVATNRNRLFGSQGQYGASTSLNSELAALVHPLGDPREVQRFTSPSQLATPLAISPTMNRRAASFVVPSALDVSGNALRPAFAEFGQGFPSLGPLRY